MIEDCRLDTATCMAAEAQFGPGRMTDAAEAPPFFDARAQWRSLSAYFGHADSG